MAEKVKRSSSSSSSSLNIPPEIIEIILSKSSSKSLLRFKAVSKSWNTIISDPLFVETHLQSSNSSNNLFLHRYEDTLVKLEGKKFLTETELKKPNGYNVILCECNGILLLRNDNSNYLLWNPSTRRERHLVYPYEESLYSINPGICYDPVTGDFKVVLIDENDYAIYSCKKDCWTRKKGFLNHASGRPGIFIDGATYWILWLKKTGQLVYFDPKTDELKKLRNPERICEDDYLYFICLRGSLCLYCQIRDDKDEIKRQIWIKEKGAVVENPNWKELITFENLPNRISFLRPICFVEDKILVQLEFCRYAYYSPSEKTFEEFEEKCFRFVPYRSSLYMTKTV